MTMPFPTARQFLFLQGPPGPFFWLLGQELVKKGHGIHRINFNGGDRVDWPGKAINYRGSQAGWNRFFDHYIRDNAITDMLLFGDCRPLHNAAHGMAKLRGVRIHVFEEGYIRPHWITMEPDGVNGNSTLSRDPDWLMQQAETLPPVPPSIPITASFNRRARDSIRYYAADCLTRWQFPLYRSHRPGSLLAEGGGWLLKFARERMNGGRREKSLQAVGRTPYFLFPLQLNSDYQIRTHSPFSSMRDATLYVMESFALNAPSNTTLVVKEHPLDCSYRSWFGYVRKQARRLGIEDRVIHVDGGDLKHMARKSLGMVTVNSTSGTLGLAAGTPVFVLGSAIYDIPGITHQGRLDQFWTAPTPPEKARYEAFRRVLHARCLISGGLASQSAIATLIESTLTRLFENSENPARLPQRVDTGRILMGPGQSQGQAAAEAVAVSTSPLSSTGT